MLTLIRRIVARKIQIYTKEIVGRNTCRGQTFKMVKIMFVQEPPRIVIVWAMYCVPLTTNFEFY